MLVLAYGAMAGMVLWVIGCVWALVRGGQAAVLVQHRGRLPWDR